MAAMFIPGGMTGWVSVGTGCLLIALAMWVTADAADRATASCAADLTAMALILLFVSPALTYSDGAPRSDGYQVPLHAHQMLGGPPMIFTTWLGLLVLACWATIALYPLLSQRGPIGRQTKITVASGILMITGMVPMAA
ncbi:MULTISPECIES: hypothetical protein [Rhodococcus]|uniref:hypothetical protein n=1 Tax=Rhodococcus TaxID=1827 RepID=UPI001179EDAA|nr:hypothetical protein [Rhodococcus sp. ACS1]